jgi:alkylation response protein AidB-like acyl-CoA dehydrogenase
MDFDDTPEEATWRTECEEFLRAHASLKPEKADLGQSFWAKARTPEEELDYAARCRAWQWTKFDAGWAGLTWPVEFGGRGLSSHLAGIFAEEESRYDLPHGQFAQSIGMAGPTIIVHGTDEQKERYLAPMLTGEETWCQLFSEPGAGSDLAGLRTAGIVDGEEMIVDGQKVWTSNAREAAFGMLLVRTDVDQPKHRGITYLIVDMATPGIDIRPLKQPTGRSEFNEVFLDDVRVPMANVIGEVNAGWGPILTTLMNERTGIGGQSGMMGEVFELARTFGVADDPVVRQDLARIFSVAETIRFLGYRVRTAASRGELPGPESSVLKLANSQRLEMLGNLSMSIMGASATLYGDDAEMGGFWQNYSFLGQWMSRIGGGTDEVQRNIMGENVLGLPQEPRPDKGIPFRDIPT